MAVAPKIYHYFLQFKKRGGVKQFKAAESLFEDITYDYWRGFEWEDLTSSSV